eukprot:3619117-Alexandrium_andersonii.AAC.1
MSASLVGSEMCIRDRGICRQERQAQLQRASLAGAGGAPGQDAAKRHVAARRRAARPPDIESG